MVKSYATEGVVLRRNNIGEADRIVTIYSKHSGKISFIAKGIRRSTSRKGGNLELFNQVKIFVAKGRNLDLITEAEVINSFQDWRKDLKKIAVAYELCELVDKLSAEGVENQEVYDLLVNYLLNLSSILEDQSPARQRPSPQAMAGGLITNFELSLLQYLGFWPRGRAIGNLDLDAYIEDLINRKLYAKKFSKRLA